MRDPIGIQYFSRGRASDCRARARALSARIAAPGHGLRGADRAELTCGRGGVHSAISKAAWRGAARSAAGQFGKREPDDRGLRGAHQHSASGAVPVLAFCPVFVRLRVPQRVSFACGLPARGVATSVKVLAVTFCAVMS